MAVLLHGDCLELMKTLPDKSVDLFLCDLPYGCLASGYRATGTHPQSTNPNQNPKQTHFKTEGCAWDIPIDLTQFWIQVKRLCRDDHTPVLMFCTVRFGYELIKSNEDWFRYDLIWNKMRGVGFLNANKQPMRSHELIYVFAKKGATYYRKDMEGDFKEWKGRKSLYGGIYGPNKMINRNETGGDGKRCVLSIVDAGSAPKKGKHPTQKPDDLYAWLIERYSKEGDTVLDPTAGSFASVFTAQRLGRKGIGIEKDDGFYAKAVEKGNGGG